MIAWVVAYFSITNVSNFTQDNHKLFVLTSNRIYDTELSFLGADKWPEMKIKLSWIRLVKASWLMRLKDGSATDCPIFG